MTKHKLSIYFCRRHFQVWFKNRRAKIRQLQKQSPTKNLQGNSTKKTSTSSSSSTTNTTTTTTPSTTKLKVKSSSALLNNINSSTSTENETGYCLKTQNTLTTLSGSSKVKSTHS